MALLGNGSPLSPYQTSEIPTAPCVELSRLSYFRV